MADLRYAVRSLTLPTDERQRPLLIWAVVLAILLAGVAWLWWLDHEHDNLDEARTGALKAAREGVVEVLSYQHRTVHEDLQRAQGRLTGDFQREFGRLTADVVQPAAEQDDITTKAEVTAAGVVSAESDVVKTLLFVSQTTTSNKLTEPKIDGSRIEVTMTRVGDRWLISELTPL